MRLVYIYLNAYWPNMHLRNEEKPLKENHAGRCLLCRAPVAKKTAVMFWELRASGDDEDMVITNDETRLLTGDEIERCTLQPIGATCFKRSPELAPYVVGVGVEWADRAGMRP